MRCVFCLKKVEGIGCNAQPLIDDVCCEKCNKKFVIPLRKKLSKEYKLK